MKLTEAQIEQACCQYLYRLGWYVFILKDQAAFREGAYRKPKPFQTAGIADAFAIKQGKSVWIEFKTPSGKQSLAQKVFQKNIEMQLGEYWIIKSVDELKERLSIYSLHR